ncbi:MAG: TonB-dependent receptor plug domain-containing protein, partial [Deltaproteobacteria bacterium]|nr:TonB-dependent receptor plug domain-containing protein [Kofleriaceae bacterium]
EFGASAVVDAPPREVTARKLRGADLTKVAGTRGDALRSIELLPGVARPGGGQGALLVRGSSPWDSGTFLEGADIPMLYHFGGLTSFVPSGLLESIDFYPGNFSVKYGRRTGGVVEVGLREPRTDRVHAVTDVSMLDASVQLEGPLTRELSFIAAARRSYMDAWFESVVPADEIGVTSAPVYLDWQLMVQWKPTDRDRVRLTGYGADDRMALVARQPDDRSPTMRGRVAAETGFHRAALAWTHRYAPTVEHEVSVATGPFYIDFDLGPSFSQRIAGTGIYSRAEWRAALASWARVTGGVDVSLEWGNFTFQGPRAMQVEGNPELANFLDLEDRTAVDIDLTYLRPAAYVETSVRPGRGVEIIAGLRSDYYGEIEQLALDPRLVVRKDLAGDVVVKGGVGRFTQPPDHGETIAGFGNPALGALSAIHGSAGIEWSPRERASVGVDAFYKRLADLVVGGEDGLENGGRGRIYGLETSARLAPGGRFSGFVSYTFSRSERNDHGMTWRRFDFDQTHVLSASGMSALGRGWTLGATLRLTSGSPDTPVVGRVYDADRDVYMPVYGAVNSERNPLFHQLDLRVEKLWHRGWGNVAAYLDLQNAYNARHVEGRTWNYDYTRSADVYGLPVLPSLGLRGEL